VRNGIAASARCGGARHLWSEKCGGRSALWPCAPAGPRRGARVWRRPSPSRASTLAGCVEPVRATGWSPWVLLVSLAAPKGRGPHRPRPPQGGRRQRCRSPRRRTGRSGVAAGRLDRGRPPSDRHRRRDRGAGDAALSAAAGLRPAPSGVHVASSAALSPQVRVDGAQPGCRHPQAPRGARARAPPSPAAGAAGRGPRGPRRAAWAGCPVEDSPSCAPSQAATPPAVVDGSQDAQRHRAVANFGDHLSRTSVIADRRVRSTMAVRALAWPRDR
jgi:hypothetical protein